MRLRQYLTELAMRKGTKIKVHKGSNEYNAEIELEGGQKWLYNAMDYDGNGIWDIVFYEPSKDMISFDQKGDKHKVALETFAAVEKLTRDFIKYHEPSVISFNAQGKSRVKLYDLLAKKIVKSKKYRLSKDGGGKFSASYYRLERT